MDVSSSNYDNVLAQIVEFDLPTQLRLLQELSGIVRQQVEKQPTRRITELQGLGKEIWQGIDAQKYVEQERSAWNG
ncbi:MAG: hypothetical protein ACE5Q6_02570 [Dehalococcoidia bacterium]